MSIIVSLNFEFEHKTPNIYLDGRTFSPCLSYCQGNVKVIRCLWHGVSTTKIIVVDISLLGKVSYVRQKTSLIPVVKVF